jgi:hypothetical protein
MATFLLEHSCGEANLNEDNSINVNLIQSIKSMYTKYTNKKYIFQGSAHLAVIAFLCPLVVVALILVVADAFPFFLVSFSLT